MSERYDVINIPMIEIFADDKFNCRGHVTPFEVIDLAKDIQANGLDQPISVQPYNHPPHKYRILAGHRRYTAFIVNSATTIPAFVVPITDEDDALAFNLRENIMRQDLTLLQEAKALQSFFMRGHNTSQIANKLNRSPGWVEVRKQLLELPSEIQEEAQKGTINQGHVKNLYLLRKNPEKMFEALRSIKEQLAKGQKVVIIKKEETVTDIIKAKKPSQHEINEALDCISRNIISKVGEDNFAARALAWSLGNISKLEFYITLKKECDKLGICFIPPDDLKKVLAPYVNQK